MLLYSNKATYIFPPLVSEEKLARRVPNVAFSVWSVWHEGREDRQLSPSLNDPDVLPVRPKGHKAAVWLL
jgi:hypothetical protein